VVFALLVVIGKRLLSRLEARHMERPGATLEDVDRTHPGT
jgi:hypothetical protein